MTGLVYFFFLCKIVDVSIFDVSDDFVSDRRTLVPLCTVLLLLESLAGTYVPLFTHSCYYYWFEVLNF